MGLLLAIDTSYDFFIDMSQKEGEKKKGDKRMTQ